MQVCLTIETLKSYKKFQFHSKGQLFFQDNNSNGLVAKIKIHKHCHVSDQQKIGERHDIMHAVAREGLFRVVAVPAIVRSLLAGCVG